MQILPLSSPHLLGPLGDTEREGVGFSWKSYSPVQAAETRWQERLWSHQLRLCLFKAGGSYMSVAGSYAELTHVNIS